MTLLPPRHSHSRITVYLIGFLLGWVACFSFATERNRPTLKIEWSDVNADIEALAGHLSFYNETDVSGDSPVDLDKISNAEFSNLTGVTIAPGQVDYPVWIRFSLKNGTNSPINRFIVLGFGYIPHVDLYYLDNQDHWASQHSGKAIPYDQRPVKHPHYPFEVEVAPGEHNYYLRLSSHAPLVVPTYIMSNESLKDYTIQIYIFGATYFGFTLALLLYKSFLFFFLKDSLYLYFVMFISFSTLAQLYLMGLLDGFVQGIPLIFLGGGDIFTQTSILFGLVFIRKLFGSYRYAENYARIYYWAIVIAFIIWIMTILRVTNIHLVVVVEIVLFSLVVLFHALKVWQAGYSPAGYFFLGWSVFTCGAIITSLIYSAVIPFTVLTVFVYPICSSFQALLLSFSLANRIKLLESEKQTSEILLQRAEAKTEAKSQFLAQMSHEIRTPMNGVLGMTQLLLDTSLNQHQRSLTDILFSSGRNLLNIINDILDFSKLEAGKLTIEKTQFNFENELEDVASNFTLVAIEKDLEFSIDYPISLPRILIGDPTRIKQALINILGNAFKFTKDGSIKCQISGELLLDDKLDLKIVIEDSGIGISKKNQKQLFGAYSQAESSTAREFGGTGLGLNITKQLVELMDGSIELRSELGQGTQFIIHIPLGFINTQDHEAIIRKRHDHSVILSLANKLLANDIGKHIKMSGYPLSPINHSQADSNKVVIVDTATLTLLSAEQHESNTIVLLHSLRDDISEQSSRHPDLKTYLYTGIPSKVVSALDELLIESNIGSSLDYLEAESEDLFKKILIVEDNKVNQMLAERFVQPYCQESVIAENGKLGLAEYTNRHDEYDLILMDCDMPVMDGYQATREIREWERKHKVEPVHILALSAHIGNEHELKVSNSGMNGIVMKPILKEKLDVTMRQSARQLKVKAVTKN